MRKIIALRNIQEVSLEEALQEFLFWKQAQGISKTTIIDYDTHIKRFFLRYPDAWQTNEFKRSVYEYLNQDIKPATYNLRLIYLRAFFNWCMTEGFLTENPLVGFKRRKASPRIVDIKEDVLLRLLSLPDRSTFAGLRDYALMLFSLDTGIRPSEALQLHIYDFDLAHLLVIIPSHISKTRNERTLPLLYVTVEHIKLLIKVIAKEWNDKVPVFCTADGLFMNRHTWNDRLKFYAKRLGVKVRPYDLRHAFAIMYLRNEGNVFTLQKILGHSDMQMTRRYVNITGLDLSINHLKASPLNSLIKNKSNKRLRKI